jgi:hypothetical protein
VGGGSSLLMSGAFGGGEGVRLAWASIGDVGGRDGGAPSLYASMVEYVPMTG